MMRLRAGLGVVAVAVMGMLAAGGCPNAVMLPGQVDTADKDETTFGVLKAIVEADPPTADVSTDDEEPYFGEDESLYAEPAPDQAVALPAESALIEARARSGAGPLVHGRLAGRFWNDLPDSTSDESGGVFRGRWYSADGELQGVLRGRYEPAPPDELPDTLAGGGIFYGKYIDLEGHFRGILRGRYGHGPLGRGLFFGYWLDRNHRLVGVLKGHWQDEPAANGGTFAGRWVAFDICEEVASLPEHEFEEGDFGGFDASDEVLDGIEPDEAAAESPEAEDDLARLIEPPCIDPDQPFGFLGGWHAPYPPEQAEDTSAPPPGGWFRGRWRDAAGVVVGVLKGRYEPIAPPPPEQDAAPPPPGPHKLGVFYGKYVDTTGQFRGFVRGVYGRSVHGLGVFRGHYYNANGQEKGILFGRWDNHPFKPGGPFFGVWNGQDPDVAPPPTD